MKATEGANLVAYTTQHGAHPLTSMQCVALHVRFCFQIKVRADARCAPTRKAADNRVHPPRIFEMRPAGSTLSSMPRRNSETLTTSNTTPFLYSGCPGISPHLSHSTSQFFPTQHLLSDELRGMKKLYVSQRWYHSVWHESLPRGHFVPAFEVQPVSPWSEHVAKFIRRS